MNNTENNGAGNTPGSSKLKTWLKRIGLAGFLFFLFKGIVWILVFAGAFKYLGCEG